MRNEKRRPTRCCIAALACAASAAFVGCAYEDGAPLDDSPQPEIVVFWHFWGGRDRQVVDEIVERFNASHDRYQVRAIAMPGNNLDLKFFLSFAGGDPPDLLNHDDPVVADWAHRGVLTALDAVAPAEEIDRLEQWLFPAAHRLGAYNGRLYALCNGLDIRALYYNKTLLDEHGLSVPRTVDELDALAVQIAPPKPGGGYRSMGYLPDPRRIWAWGPVFGGRFYDASATTPDTMITGDSPEIVRALAWMASYSQKYGANEVAAFRSGEQAVTGDAFSLLQNRRYAAVMDGQWRLRDIAMARQYAQRRRLSFDEYGVAPLPTAADGPQDAGWVNGNFFVIPRNAANKRGAWEFAKFWTGFDGAEPEAAKACAAGGWIPASQQVVDQPPYQDAIRREPMLATFVQLAASPRQLSTPPIPVATYYYQQIVQAAEHMMFRDPQANPSALLRDACDRVRRQLREATRED